MKYSKLLPLILVASFLIFQIGFMTHKAYAMHVFPLGKYDIDPDYCSVVNNTVTCNDASGIPNKGLIFRYTTYSPVTSISSSTFSNFGDVKKIHHVDTGEVWLNSWNMNGKNMDGSQFYVYLNYKINLTEAKYMYICAYGKVLPACSGCSYVNSYFGVGYYDLSSNTPHYVTWEYDGCNLINLDNIKPYLSTGDTRLMIYPLGDAVYISDYIDIYSIQFLTANFTPVDPIYNTYDTIYYNDFSNTANYKPYCSWSIDNGNISEPTLNNPNTAFNSQNLNKVVTWTYNTTTQSTIGIHTTPTCLNTSNKYYNWAEIGTLFQAPDSISKVAYILRNDNNKNSIEFDFDRRSNKASLFLEDEYLNVLSSITGLSSPINITNTSMIFYIRENINNDDTASNGRLLIINNNQNTDFGRSYVYMIPYTWLETSSFSTNYQSMLFVTDPANETLNMSRFEFYSLSYSPPSLSGAQISWESTNVTTQYDDHFTISWLYGQPPFNVTIYINGPYNTQANVTTSDNSYSSDIVFGLEGDYDTYAVITDSNGDSVTTNHVTVHVYSPPSPINNYHTVINGIESIPYAPPVNITVHYGDTIHVKIYNVTGGTPPYNITFKSITTGDSWTITNSSSPASMTLDIPVDQVNNYLVCTPSNSNDLGNGTEVCENVFESIVTDSDGNTKTEQPHYIYLSKSTLGPPLNVSISLNTITNLTVSDSTRLTVTISGGVSPYHIVLNDGADTTLCDYTTSGTTSSIVVYWYGGDHTDVYAYVESEDGQTATSNVLNFTVEQSPTLNRIKDYVIGCSGTTSGWATNSSSESIWGTPPTPSGNYTYNTNMTQPIQGVNVTEWQEAGFGWALFLFTPIFWATLFAIGIAGGSAYVFGGEHKGPVFGVVLALIIILLAVAGIYPWWVAIIFIIVAGGIVAVFVKNMF